MRHAGLIHFTLKNMRIFFFFFFEILMITICHLTNCSTKVFSGTESSSSNCQSTAVIGPYSPAHKHNGSKPQTVTNNMKIKRKSKKIFMQQRLGLGSFFTIKTTKKLKIKTSFQCAN